MTTLLSFAGLPDSAVLARVKELAHTEFDATAALVAALAEVDARRLYLGEGCSSLFAWATNVLHLSESAAYKRIEAARAARRFPAVLERLARGDVHLTAICKLAPHLTGDNHLALLDAARHRSKREVEELVARVHPREDVATTIRKLPSATASARATVNDSADAVAFPDSSTVEPAATAARDDRPSTPHADESREMGSGTGSESADARRDRGDAGDGSSEGQRLIASLVPSGRCANVVHSKRPDVVSPLSPGRYKLQVTIGAETRAKLERAQNLLRHRIPNGDMEQVLDLALTALIEQVERKKAAAVRRPRNASACPADDSPAPAGCHKKNALRRSSRHIPAVVKREVWARDQGQCAYVGTTGRCRARGCLEYHHVVPHADGGPATTANTQLRCRSHNTYEAWQWSGRFEPSLEDRAPAGGAGEAFATKAGEIAATGSGTS